MWSVRASAYHGSLDERERDGRADGQQRRDQDGRHDVLEERHGEAK